MQCYICVYENLFSAYSFQTALAHLESLGFDLEEAQPPATKEAIDSLPRIIVTDDHGGMEK